MPAADSDTARTLVDHTGRRMGTDDDRLAGGPTDAVSETAARATDVADFDAP